MPQKGFGVPGFSSFLQHCSTYPRAGQCIQFPDHLINDLVEAQFSIDHRTLRTVISIIKKTPNLCRALLADSIRCLACVLLGSNAQTGPEHALRLLLHDSAEKTSGVTPLPAKQSKLIQCWLIAALYRVFLGDGFTLRLRRLAGKLLLEALTVLKPAGEFNPEDLLFLDSRLASLFCRHEDTVLQFLAGSILRRLSQSAGAYNDTLWAQECAEFHVIFLKSLHTYPDTWPKSFLLYNREAKRPSAQALCHSITYLKLAGISYADYFMLASTTADSISFMIPVNKLSDPSFQFIEVPLKQISWSNFHRAECGKSQLWLHIGKHGVLINNGIVEMSSGPVICLASDEDLSGIIAIVQRIDNERQSQAKSKDQACRRPSSVVISLDTGDEVAEKSSQYFERPSCMVKPAAETSHEQQDIQPVEAPNARAGSISAGVRHSDSQPSSIILPSGKGSIEGVVSAVRSPQLPGLTWGSTAGTQVAAGFAEKSADFSQIHNIESRALEMGPAGPRGGSERPKAGGLGHPLSGEMLVPVAETNEAPPSNTQESLLFHRPRRTKRKVYMAPFNTVVDWDEDLRPTDDGEKTDAERDIDFTSVSSPAMSNNSTLIKTVGTTKKRRNPVPPRKARKGRKGERRQKGKTTELSNGRFKGSRLPLHPLQPNADSEQSRKLAHRGQDNHGDESGGAHGSSKGCARYGAGETEESLRHTPNSVLSVRESISPCKSGGPSPCGRLDDRYTGITRALSPHSDVTSCLDETCGSPTINSSQAEAHGDIGQSSNTKDYSIWETKFNSLAKAQHGRGGMLGKKLTAALFHANDPSVSSPLKSEESGARSPRSKGRLRYQVDLADSQNSGPQLGRNDKPQPDIQLAEPALVYENLAVSPPGEALEDNLSKVPTPVAGGQTSGLDDHSRDQEAILSSYRKRVIVDDHNIQAPKKLRPHLALEEKESRKDASQAQEGPCAARDKTSGLSSAVPSARSASWAIAGDGAPRATRSAGPSYMADSEENTAMSLSHTPMGGNLIVKSLPKTVIDTNGSPYLRSGKASGWQPVESPSGWWQQRPVLSRKIMLECSQQASTGDCFDSNTTGRHHHHPLLTFRDRVQLYLDRDQVQAEQREVSMETENRIHTREAQQGLSTTREKKESLTDTYTRVEDARSVSTSVGLSDADANVVRAMPQQEQASLAPSAREPLGLEKGLPALDAQEGESTESVWLTSLQTFQRSTESILRDTNHEITRHMQREQDAMSRVLEIYVEGCHRILDQLFQAQEERIAIHRRHMEMAREYQANLCRGLMQRLDRKRHQL